MESPKSYSHSDLYLEVPDPKESPSCIYLRDTEELHRIVFYAGGNRIVELCGNGDILVHGKLVENDKEVVEGMREFLSSRRVG